MPFRSGIFDNLLPVLKPRPLSVCVCICMCEHSWHGQASELSAPRGGASRGLVDQLSEPWKASSSFIITLCWKITVRQRDQAAFSCLCTQSTLLSCSQSFIYPLNPFFSIACEQLLLSHEINLFCVRLDFKAKRLLFLTFGWRFLKLFDPVFRSWNPVCWNSGFCFVFLRAKWNLLKDPLGVWIYSELLVFHLNISDVYVSIWQISCDPVCKLNNHK